jgi:hypothetical protein
LALVSREAWSAALKAEIDQKCAFDRDLVFAPATGT